MRGTKGRGGQKRRRGRKEVDAGQKEPQANGKIEKVPRSNQQKSV